MIETVLLRSRIRHAMKLTAGNGYVGTGVVCIELSGIYTDKLFHLILLEHGGASRNRDWYSLYAIYDPSPTFIGLIDCEQLRL